MITTAMHKINVKQFRLLYSIMKDKEKYIDLLLVSGNNIIDIHNKSFAGYPLDRKTTKELFLQCCNVNTTKWQYLTNWHGKAIIDANTI